jgi:hypothetical protein
MTSWTKSADLSREVPKKGKKWDLSLVDRYELKVYCSFLSVALLFSLSCRLRAEEVLLAKMDVIK